MKILHTVETYLPQRHGMSEVVRQVSERLVKMGHEVTVVTQADYSRCEHQINGVAIKEFNITGNTVLGVKGDFGSYQEFLLNSEFDVITNFAAQQWASDLTFPLLSLIKAKKIFVPTGFSGLFNPAYRSYFDLMPGWLKYYDCLVFPSLTYRDVTFVKNACLENLVWIPNGAASDEFSIGKTEDIRKKLNLSADQKIILHVGGYTGIKGHSEALEIFARSKIRNATLLFVSDDFIHCNLLKLIAALIVRVRDFFRRDGAKSLRHSPELFQLKTLLFSSVLRKDQKNIRTIALSRRSLIDAYHEAEIFLFPSLLECSPIVIFECIASKTPFLASDVGNVKEIIQWTNSGVLLPGSFRRDTNLMNIDKKAASFILTDLVNNPRKRLEYAENGFRSWKEQFTWEKISLMYLDIYERLIRGEGLPQFSRNWFSNR